MANSSIAQLEVEHFYFVCDINTLLIESSHFLNRRADQLPNITQKLRHVLPNAS